jgi:hypothetical protein
MDEEVSGVRWAIVSAEEFLGLGLPDGHRAQLQSSTRRLCDALHNLPKLRSHEAEAAANDVLAARLSEVLISS